MEEYNQEGMDLHVSSENAPLNKASLQKLLKQRASKQKNISMQYFWSSFVMQIIVYSLLSYVVVKYGNDTSLLLMSLLCILIYIPFTIVLLRYFKKIALLKANDKHAFGLPMGSYIQEHYFLLKRFYKFKLRYEALLILCSTAIMIWIVFRIYVPGGLDAYPLTALSLFLLTILSCALAIHKENTRSFKLPLKQLENMLKEFR